MSEFQRAMESFETQLVRGVLIQAKGNSCQAAKIAGLHRNTFGRKVRKYKINIQECREIARAQQPMSERGR